MVDGVFDRIAVGSVLGINENCEDGMNVGNVLGCREVLIEGK